MKTGLRTLGPASLRLSFSQVIPSHLRGSLREVTHLHCAEQGKGHASALMNQLSDEADKENITLMVTVKPYEDGLDLSALTDWYARLGFQLLQESPRIMIRLPARVMAAYG